eukprot:CAMPEP_0185909094 /NCGR_PEP_ID=MMETSP0196C-20130402/10946_1 /TAXON_ID=2932 /ORGANISM="Alexandrium fundyense, Strain CCMP1719" /LENGTH=52 /DNA_ID=CAMNT_0028629503 /DNA_START=62 /DNA_END=217 /DNA_ORIENTATION=-
MTMEVEGPPMFTRDIAISFDALAMTPMYEATFAAWRSDGTWKPGPLGCATWP